MIRPPPRSTPTSTPFPSPPLFRSRLRLGRSASFGAADGPHRSAAAAAAEVGVAAIGLEPRYTHARRHVDFLQDLSRLGVDPPQVALVAFPRAVPEFAVDPGDAGDDAVGLDGAKNGAQDRKSTRLNSSH